MKKIYFLLLVLIATMLSVACDKKSSSTSPDTNTKQSIMIDASSYTEWKYFSFQEGKLVEYSNTNNWDLAFNRYKIKTNSGTSGQGNAGVLDLGVVDFNSVDKAPQNWYTIDDSITVVMMTADTYSANKALEDWYVMAGGMPPTLSAKNNVYAIRTADGKYAKLKFTDYYNPQTTASGFISFDFLYDIPVSSTVINNNKEALINATNDSLWVYFNFKEGHIVSIEEPETSDEWDIAFNRFKIKTNSGSSGNLGKGVMNAGVIDFNSYRLVPPTGYTVDETVTNPMTQEKYSASPVLADWYNYNHQTHAITSKNEVFVIQNEWHKFVKFQIINYYDQNNISGHYTIKYEIKIPAVY